MSTGITIRALTGIVIFFGIMLCLQLVSWLAQSLLPKSYLINKAGFSQAVYSNDGNLLKLTLSTDDKYRLFTPLSEISDNFKNSLLTHEDKYFYFHPGFNPFALTRSLWLTYILKQRTGGSTISMQLARMRFGINSKTISGKLSQIIMAIYLELIFSKEKIFEAYLNLIPFGGNIEGTGAASIIYLKKDATQLNLAESILLAVIPESPRARDPSKNKSDLQIAAKRLLAKMSKKTEESKVNLDFVKLAGTKDSLPKLAPHLVHRVSTANTFISKINSTIDLNFQLSFEQQIKSFVQKNKSIGITNATALLLDCNSMQVKAYVGSADFFNKDILGQVDGLSARRSPGSVLKPFLYGLSIEKGIIHPGSILKDINFSRAAYNPENFERDFVGPISATEALVRSRNLPAVMLLNQVGPTNYLDFLKNAGVKNLKSTSVYGLSLALGGAEVQADEIASMYCMFLNQGEISPIRFTQQAEIETKKLLSPESAFLVREMLKENDPPANLINSHSLARDFKTPWKTGTSFGFRDAWAAGLPGKYSLVVWVGNFDGHANPAFIGRDTAGILFFKLVDTINSFEKLSEPSFRNLNVKKVRVCALSGDLPGKHCKAKKDSWFIPGKSPIQTCHVHRAIRIDPKTGLGLCKRSNKTGIEKVFEFWPSDLLAVFAEAGIVLQRPPKYEEICLGSGTHLAPSISSPQEKVIYRLEKNRLEIPFTAVTDADVTSISWFIDDYLLGTVKNNETFFWQAKPGNFLVRVVDDQGRSNSLYIKVVGKELQTSF